MSIDVEFIRSCIADARESALAMENIGGTCGDCRMAVEETEDGPMGHGGDCEVASVLDALESIDAHLTAPASPAPSVDALTAQERAWVNDVRTLPQRVGGTWPLTTRLLSILDRVAPDPGAQK